MRQGIFSMTRHSTATFNRVFNTVRMLLTVFGAFSRRPDFRRCTSSFPMPSSRFDPSTGARWTLQTVSLAAIPLGFCRLARA